MIRLKGENRCGHNYHWDHLGFFTCQKEEQDSSDHRIIMKIDKNTQAVSQMLTGVYICIVIF